MSTTSRCVKDYTIPATLFIILYRGFFFNNKKIGHKGSKAQRILTIKYSFPHFSFYNTIETATVQKWRRIKPNMNKKMGGSWSIFQT
jgi:hypothetical protein